MLRDCVKVLKEIDKGTKLYMAGTIGNRNLALLGFDFWGQCHGLETVCVRLSGTLSSPFE